MAVVITKWKDLTDLDRERLVVMYPYLDEFCEGTALFHPVLPTDPRTNRPAHRFFRNAVFQYLDAFYTEGNNGILPVLDSIGRKDMADIVRSTLANPIGNSTFGTILRSWRNKGIAHLTFRVDHLVNAVSDADLLTGDNGEEFMVLVCFLAQVTSDLRDMLRLAYPEVVYLDRRPGDPVDNPPSPEA